jgi:tetratricopeptide (TPR) repeat protein
MYDCTDARSQTSLFRIHGLRAGGQFDRGIADDNRAIALNPNIAAAYVGRGIAYRFKGEYDRAIADDTEALQPDRVVCRGLCFAVR